MGSSRNTLFIYRGAIQKRILRRNNSPKEFLYGMNEVGKSSSTITHIEIPKGKRTGIRIPLNFIEKPFAQSTKLGFPLEIYWYGSKQIRKSHTIICVNDAIGFSILFWKMLGLVRSEVIVILQSLPERYKYFNTNRRLVKFIALLLRQASTILTLSDIAHNQLQDIFNVPAKKIKTFRFGVDTRFWKPLKHPKHKQYILTIGNDMNRDNPTLYKALTGKDRLIHVSSNEISDLGSEAAVQTLSNISDKHVRQLYREAYVVVIPSISLVYESSGLSTILQAMACGTPVIASYIPTLDEVFTNKKNILFFNPESVQDLKRTLTWARKHPKKLEKIAQNGYNLVQEKYTTQHMGAQWEQILQ